MIVGTIVDGKPTYTAVGAGGCACLAPVLCVSVKSTHYITDGIKQSGYFSINIPPSTLVKELDYCGIVSGFDVDKSGLFTAFFDEQGTAPLIEACSLNFLCKVCDSKQISDFTMFFGDIVAVYADEACVIEGKVDPIKVDPIIMMAYSYCDLKSVIGRPFAAGKALQNESNPR